MARPSPRDLVLLALTLAYGLGLYGALAGIPNQPEHEPHLFIADHLFHHYFDLWEPRWYGGVRLIGHPPLAHELVALLAHVPGLNVERAYALICVGAALLVVLGCATLGRELWGASPGATAGALIAAFPLLYLFLFPFGQLPFVLGCGLGLLAAAQLVRDADTPLRGWASAALLGGAALCSHPVALLPVLLGAFLALLSPRPSLPRIALALAGALALGAVACLPFWTSLAAHRPPPMALAKLHATSGPFELALSAMLVAIALAGLLWAQTTRDRLLALLPLAGLLFTVASPWPLVSPDKVLWLSGLVALLVFSQGALDPVGWRGWLPLGLAATLAVTSAAVLGRPRSSGDRHRRTALVEVTSFLQRSGNERWRYLTLGLGNARFELLRRAPAGSLDGGMPWLSPPLLSGTSFFSLDEIPLADPQGRAVLSALLARANSYSLRWVISGNPLADPILRAAGYEVRSALRDQIVLWSNDRVPALTQSEHPADPDLPWSVLPPTAFVLGLGLFLRQRWTTLREAARAPGS